MTSSSILVYLQYFATEIYFNLQVLREYERMGAMIFFLFSKINLIVLIKFIAMF